MKKFSANFGVLAGLVVALGLSTMAQAQEWPSRPIELIVPWSAGGGTDATGRMVAELLSEQLGQPVNVVNRTGGGGVVGHSAIAEADPDGYTIGVLTTELSMFETAGTSPLTFEDYSLVALYNEDVVGVFVAAGSDIQDAGDLVDALRDDPGALNASGANFGGAAHLSMVGFALGHDLPADSFVWVPSEGSAPSMQELAAGTIQVVTTTMPEGRSMVDAGEARALVALTDQPVPGFETVPTIVDATGADIGFGAWRGIAGPEGLPDDVVERLSTAMEQVVSDPRFVEFMSNRGFTIRYLDSGAFRDFLDVRERDFSAAMEAAGLAQ